MDAQTVATITDAVVFTAVVAGMGTIFAASGLLNVTLAGGRKLLSAIR